MRVLVRPFGQGKENANPYVRLLNTRLTRLAVELAPATKHKLLTGRYDLLHIHWPEHYLKLGSANPISALLGGHVRLALIAWAKWRGIRLIWTVHNLRSHEARRRWLERWYWYCFTRMVDGIISLSNSGLDLCLNAYPHLRNRPTFVIPHGHYRDAYPNEIGRDAARSRLNLAAATTVIGYFGVIKPYKNVERLIMAFRNTEGEDMILLVAGACDQEHERLLHQLAQGDRRIVLHLHAIAHGEVQVYLNSMDFVVLPFTDILNSGSAILALSFSRPIVVPDIGSMKELKELVGEQWCYCYNDKLTAKTLQTASGWATKTGRPGFLDLSALDWDNVAKKTLHAYEQVLDRREIMK